MMYTMDRAFLTEYFVFESFILRTRMLSNRILKMRYITARDRNVRNPFSKWGFGS